MKTLLAAACVLLLLAPHANELEFQASKGSEVEKLFSERTRWTLESMERQVDGQPIAMPTPNMSGTARRELTVLDKCAAASDGVATRLEREFRHVSGASELQFAVREGSDDMALELGSALEGAKLVYERREPTAEPSVRFAEGAAGDAKLLRGLREDLDLRALLPDEDVGVEDHWRLEASRLVDVLCPGGELALLPATNSVPASEFLDPSEVLATTLCTCAANTGELAGEALLTWRRTRKEGERELAVIEIDYESTARTDLGEELQRRLRAAGASTLRDDLALLMSSTSTGEGELVWDLRAKRCVSFSLSLDTKLDVLFSWTEEDADVGYHFTLAAKQELSATHTAQ